MSDYDTAWTEQELESALRDFTDSLAPDEATVRRLRSSVLAAAGAEATALQLRLAPTGLPAARPRRARRGLVVAFGALAAAACVLTVGVVKFGDSTPPASADAVSVLVAAAAGTTPDPEPAGGQFRLIASHSWDLNYTTNATGKATEIFLVEHLTDVWEPASYQATWLQRSQTTGKLRWYVPATEPAGADGLPAPSKEDARATCGNFYGDRGCSAPGTWQDPTQSWIDALPRDPAKLYSLLKKDAPRNGRGDAEIFTYAADALRTGLLPSDVRVALYKAMTRLHGLTVTQKQATLDGSTGTALGISDGNTIQEIIIDSVTGQFIGEQDIYARAANGLPKGAVQSSSSVAVKIVSAIGADA